MPWSPPHHDRTKELRDHSTRREWRGAITEICARHALDGGTPAPFPSGSDVVWSAGEWVVKLTAPLWRDEIEAEARCLERVRGRLGVRTPDVLATGELAGWPYIVMSRIPGSAIGAAWPALGQSDRLRLARDIGGLMRSLHTIDVGGAADGWDEFWSECRSDVSRRHAQAGVPTKLVNEIEPFLESVGSLPCAPRVLLHTEILHEHVLVEDRGGRLELCGLIDFADGRVGPPGYEFPAPVEFLFKGQVGLLRACLLAYGFSESELSAERSRQLLAWGLLHRFGLLARMLQAVAPAQPASLAELARRLYGLDP